MFSPAVRFAVLLAVVAGSSSLLADDSAQPKGLEFRLAETKQDATLTKVVLPESGKTIYVHREHFLTDKDVASVSFAPDANGHIAVTLEFSPAAAKKLAETTKAHRGKPVAIMLDGKVISAPVVRSVLSAKAQINGDFSNAELVRMFSALVLHADVASVKK